MSRALRLTFPIAAAVPIALGAVLLAAGSGAGQGLVPPDRFRIAPQGPVETAIATALEKGVPRGVSSLLEDLERQQPGAEFAYTPFVEDALLLGLRGQPVMPAAPEAVEAVVANLDEEQARGALQAAADLLSGTIPPENLDEVARLQNSKPETVQARAAAQAAGDERTPTADLPDFDWTQPNFVSQSQGIVTPARFQGACGSCWAFGTIGAFEAAYARATRHVPDAAEQELLNCMASFVRNDPTLGGLPWGCDGGWWAFDYLIARGLPIEPALPYQGTPASCSNQRLLYRAAAWGYVSQSGIADVATMKQALCDHGPLVAALRSTPALLTYRSGVFAEDLTPGQQVNHAILIIGWRTIRDLDGRPDEDGGAETDTAWVIKNSWGPLWGTNGFGLVHARANGVGTGAAWVRVSREPIRP